MASQAMGAVSDVAQRMTETMREASGYKKDEGAQGSRALLASHMAFWVPLGCP